MRGAGRTAGRSFKPRSIERANDPLDLVDNTVNFFIGELPVPPTLSPINDEWSISPILDWDATVDPRDCSKYPASPYCENDLFRFGPPIGYDFEIRTNGCTTCLYIYPVVGWMRLTPTIVCKQDKDCASRRDTPPPRSWQSLKPPRLNENVQADRYKSPECALSESLSNAYCNFWNDENEQKEKSFYYHLSKVDNSLVSLGDKEGSFDFAYHLEWRKGFIREFGKTGLNYAGIEYSLGNWGTNQETGEVFFDPTLERITSVGNPATFGFIYKTFTPDPCLGMEPPPPRVEPPPLPPPFGRDDDRKKKKKPEEKMCCNTCNDAKDNSDKILKELKEIKKIIGTGKLPSDVQKTVKLSDQSLTGLLNLLGKTAGVEKYPIQVPDSILQGYGDGVAKLQSSADFAFWFASQMDALVGQFPIDIEVKDIDPLKEGDQTKKIQLPNIAEAIAEIYGLTIKSSVNQEVELNMLLRLAAEVVATKNATIVAQDYSRANATFLGYKANYKPRELTYNFDFAGANLDPKSKEPIVLEKLLKTVQGYVQGWQIDDKETVVGFLQKLMFSAGIIKAVFFRGKGQQKELQREINSMTQDEATQEAKFEAFIKEINDPNSRFNKTTQDKPEIKDETPPDQKPKGAK